MQALSEVIRYPLNQFQVDALADLLMSVSPAFIRGQNQIKEYINNYFSGAIDKDALVNWWSKYRTTINNGATVLTGLRERRKKEIDLFFSTNKLSALLIEKKFLRILILVLGLILILVGYKLHRKTNKA